MYQAVDQVKTVTSIGAGPIGGGWAAFFLARGYKVRAYIHTLDEEPMFRSVIDTAWPWHRDGETFKPW